MRGHGAAGPMSCWAAGELGCWVDGPLGCWVTGRKVRGAKVQTRRGATNEERGRHLRQRVTDKLAGTKWDLIQERLLVEYWHDDWIVYCTRPEKDGFSPSALFHLYASWTGVVRSGARGDRARWHGRPAVVRS
jgi:hypothetical protein